MFRVKIKACLERRGDDLNHSKVGNIPRIVKVEKEKEEMFRVQKYQQHLNQAAKNI